jgi:hypothetical protein
MPRNPSSASASAIHVGVLGALDIGVDGCETTAS